MVREKHFLFAASVLIYSYFDLFTPDTPDATVRIFDPVRVFVSLRLLSFVFCLLSFN